MFVCLNVAILMSVKCLKISFWVSYSIPSNWLYFILHVLLWYNLEIKHPSEKIIINGNRKEKQILLEIYKKFGNNIERKWNNRKYLKIGNKWNIRYMKIRTKSYERHEKGN